MNESTRYPGRLIAVEGLDGSGKSTQIYLLKRWMEMQNLKVFFTEWNSSVLVKEATRKGKKRQLLTVGLPRRIHSSGLTVITPANTRTNAGQLVRTFVRTAPINPTTAGEVRFFTVLRGRNGRVAIRTYGFDNLRIRVTQRAPATSEYLPFERRATYTNWTRGGRPT